MHVESSSASLSFAERRRRLATRATWGGVLTFTVLVASGFPYSGWLAFGALAIAIVAWVFKHVARAARRLPPPVVVDVESARLVVSCAGNEQFHLPLDHVEAGWLEEPDHVVVALRGGDQLRVKVKDGDDGRDLLVALRVGAADRVLRVPIYSWAGTVPAGELMAAIALSVLVPSLVALLAGTSDVAWRLVRVPSARAGVGVLVVVLLTVLTGAALSGVIRLLSRREVVVGTDGIVVEGVGRRRILPIRDVTGVSHHANRVLVECGSAPVLRLPTARVDPVFPVSADSEQQNRALVLEARIREIMQSARAGSARDKAVLLQRSGIPLHAWRRELERLAQDSGDYRRRTLSADELVELAADGAGEVEQRVAAAYVLGRMPGAPAAMLDRIVRATADPRLARGLRDAGAGELDERLLRVARTRE